MKNSRCYDTYSLAEYCVGGGSETWRREVEEHVANCEACGRELAALQGTGELIESMPRQEAPDQWYPISARLEPRQSGWLGFPALYRAAGYVTAVFALLGIGIFAGVQYLAPGVDTQVARQVPARADSDDDHSAALTRNHVTLAWNDPFSDAASLAVIAAEERRQD